VVLHTFSWSLAALAFVAISIAPAAGAEATPTVTDCDRLASNPEDPNKTAPGLRFWDIDPSLAIDACDTALQEQPDVARLQYQYALALWRGRRFPEVLIWLRKAAEQAYPAAQADLGFAYDRGRGMPQEYRDDAQSIRFARLAADQGYSVAMADVGNHYMHGRGVPRDFAEALKWLQWSLEHEDRYAESHLGEMYKNGWGVAQSDADAVKWFRRSAEQGYRGGQFNLAMMYLDGRGVPRDFAAAEELLQRAAKQQLPQAMRELERLRTEKHFETIESWQTDF
jgi:uncharacterized protein